jgi:hypothetical protein
VAVHAVEEGPLAVAIDGFTRLGRERVRRRRHRIEHASLCPPALVPAIAACGATVVTHPAFLPRFWAKYRTEIDREQWSWLYPLRAFRDAGVPVALGSDAPIAPAAPLETIAAAVARRVEERQWLRDGQEVTASAALILHTAGGAWASGEEHSLGRLTTGALGDAVVLEADPTAVPIDEIASIPVRVTVIGGEVVWTA